MEHIEYPSDLTDEQWHFIEEILPKPKPRGRPIKTDMRSVVKALFLSSKRNLAPNATLPRLAS